MPVLAGSPWSLPELVDTTSTPGGGDGGPTAGSPWSLPVVIDTGAGDAIPGSAWSLPVVINTATGIITPGPRMVLTSIGWKALTRDTI